MANDSTNSFLRIFSKATCYSTIFLIFVGGLVTSTGSGLAVPDWPLSYGMLFPPMVGGVFYEHGHRMVATLVGMLTLGLAVSVAMIETRAWVKKLAWTCLVIVIFQGLLGGLTVLLMLPTWVSVSHGVLAQTFLGLTVILAYALSKERMVRALESAPEKEIISTGSQAVIRMVLILIFLIYAQLLAGALMRHTHAGLAVPDFPTMGGEWWPLFDQRMINTINAMRFDMNLPDVNFWHVSIHLIHRAGALILFIFLVALNLMIQQRSAELSPPVKRTVLSLNFLFALQLTLGILTVLSHKQYHLTSLHVVMGAIFLGVAILLLLRIAPLSLKNFCNLIRSPNP